MTFYEWLETFINKDYFNRSGVPEFDKLAYHQGMKCAFYAGRQDALVNQWVSVDDSLPENNQRVIAKDMGIIGPAMYDGSVWWSSVTGLHKITHWIPMPELPE